MSILYVEDDEYQQQLFSTIINKLYPKITIICVDNGKKCIELLKKQKFDIIFMDLNINGFLNGVQTTKYIKHTLKLDVPVIALTGSTDVQSRYQTDKANIETFINKPYKVKKISDIINKYL